MAPVSVDAYMIGEHGDSVIAAWSAASIAGMPLEKAFWPRRHENGEQLDERYHSHVRDAAYAVYRSQRRHQLRHRHGLEPAFPTPFCTTKTWCCHRVYAVGGRHSGKRACISAYQAVINREGAVRVLKCPLDEHEQQRFAEESAALL